jgi:DNA polymerase III delta subunit
LRGSKLNYFTELWLWIRAVLNDRAAILRILDDEREISRQRVERLESDLLLARREIEQLSLLNKNQHAATEAAISIAASVRAAAENPRNK